MEAQRILEFLRGITANNNRPWFLEHKDEYDACRKNFNEGIARAINRYAEFDDEIAHLQVKDCVYRFNRDTRFSPDKSPYKRHLGAYICSKGKKSLRGGYYIHLEPGNCMLATGSYWLPTNILTSCRNEIMGNIDRWLEAVENPKFRKLFGKPNQGIWPEMENEDAKGSEKGFGLVSLKTCPAGFPRDYEHIEYLRMKDYCCWRRVPDTFFEGDDWLEESSKIFIVAKPMMDFMNAVIDDYE
ncbi:MAG: DUF2461 domain-containing protein [Prevotella sp.]|nr:DUF2461 domain-containing protein [Prevotella sp.]